MTEMRVLVTGLQGQVATALGERAGPGNELVMLGRPQFDLAEPAALANAIVAARPDVVINAAAYTAVDKAESEPELAHRVNAEAAGLVAAAAAEIGAPILQVSTDYVFDGSLDRPYREDDPTAPLGVYGASKLAGEKAVMSANPRYAILRTAWVYAPFGANFVRTMLRLGETRDVVRVVADQQGCPTNALDIADTLLAVARQLVARPDEARLTGVFNMAGGDATTWADFAEGVFAEGERFGRRAVKVLRISTSDYPTPAKRPANSRLDPAKLAEVYGLRLPGWRASLPGCVARLLSASA
jgi:dTDP-4-dehydrorhamnose reductase